MGVKVRVACEPTGLIVNDDGRFGGFEFADGQRLESDLVVYGIGISPRDELARQAGIRVSSRGGIEGEFPIFLSQGDQDLTNLGDSRRQSHDIGTGRLRRRGVRIVALKYLWSHRSRNRSERSLLAF